MSEAVEQIDAPASTPDLKEAIQRVRLVVADQADGVSDLMAAERARLELLCEQLVGVFADVPAEMSFFNLALSGGDTPRLWIDTTSHVVMGRDRRTYRFVKDTRLGRSVLAETVDRGEMAEAITDYVAERVIEREQALEGDWLVARARRVPAGSPAHSHFSADPDATAAAAPQRDERATPGPQTYPLPEGIAPPANEDHPAAAVSRRIRRQHPLVQVTPAPQSRATAHFSSFLFGVIVGAVGLYIVAWLIQIGTR